MKKIFRPLLGTVLLMMAMLLPLGGTERWQVVSAQDGQDGNRAGATLAPVAPALKRQLAQHRGPVSFLVILKNQPNPTTELALRQRDGVSAVARRAAVYRYLTDFARRSQRPLRTWLDAQGVPYRAFYLFNGLEVQGDIQLVEALRRRDDVARLAANPEVAADLPRDMRTRSEPEAQLAPDIPYGIRYTRAPEVWALGYTGAGIVVGSQDTGAYWEHPALRDQYRGWDSTAQTVTHVYNWYDPWGAANRSRCDPDPQVPCDDLGHGTHTIGTMVGRDNHAPGDPVTIGMAYDAKWIGCRNMLAGNGSPESYTACFEFLLAPFPQGGDPQVDGDPAKGAHIINNSWYCPPDEGCDYDSLRQVVQNVRAAGILIVASAGNNGPRCSSVQFPISAYPEVFSVGSHSGTGAVSSFSSRGPVIVDGSGRLKPQIMAAGESVLSSVLGGGYARNSGTSMAAPHVAGAAALIWSAVPSLIGQVDATEQILMKSATPVLHNGCDASPVPISPNNTYGFGRLDVASAVDMALHPGVITTTINTPGGKAISGVRVRLIDARTGYTREANLQAPDQLRFSPVYAGDYGVEVKSPSGMWATTGLTLGAGEQMTVTLDLAYRYIFPEIYNQGAVLHQAKAEGRR